MVDDWKVRIKSQIKGELDVNPTGQALADLNHEEQNILAKEVRWLQDKAWKARRRAGERKEHTETKHKTPSSNQGGNRQSRKPNSEGNPETK